MAIPRTNSRPNNVTRASAVADQHIEHPKEIIHGFFPTKAGLVRPRSSSSSAMMMERDQQHLNSYNTTVVNAVRNRDVEKLRELLEEQDQCFDACNSNGEYLIHLACRRADLVTIQFLVLEAGVDTHVKDNIGRSILHDACWRPSFEPAVMIFLLKVVDPLFLILEDNRGHSPLDYARSADRSKWNDFLREHREQIVNIATDDAILSR